MSFIFIKLDKTNVMLKKLFILSAFLFFSNTFFAQAMQGPDGSKIGTIKADGTVLDEANKVVGKFKKDGMVTGKGSEIIGWIRDNGLIADESNKTVGYVGADGIVQDDTKKTIGYIKIDGTVQNEKNEVIGTAKNIPLKWVAVYFFFLF